MAFAAVLPVAHRTVRSCVEASFRLGLDHFTPYFAIAPVFGMPAFIFEARRVGGIPGLAADILGSVAAYICVVSAALQALDGHELNVRDTLWQIHRPALGKLLVLGALQASLITFGVVLFVVPGLCLMTIWAAAVPALLVEEIEFVDAFRRSAELTSDRRWRVLGASAACLAFSVVAMGSTSLVLSALPIVVERAELRPLLHWLAAGAVTAFIYPLSAVLYVLLRQEKEGLTVSQVAGTLH
jgi:hypothetical protein